MSKSKAKRVLPADHKAFDLPPLPSLLTQPLGLEGWTALEPVLLAALASEDPLLLIGPHGSAKSFLLERLAKMLGLEYRFYNASLINYDDLVGIPMPDEDRKGLHYISTPSAIWDAEVVFFDEINRTRPELQNKLFPIVHERRVQGISLNHLRYRWSAMNPPPAADAADETVNVYLGAEPIDPALADRFNFLIEVPDWQKLTEEEKRRVFRDQFKGAHTFPVPPAEIVAKTRRRLEQLQQEPPLSLENYLLSLLGQLESHRILLSARRATMLHRNILAVHAARLTLYEAAFPNGCAELADWNTSALLAVRNSLPQTAQGRHLDSALILGAHRQAWELSRLDDENPWRQLLVIRDPLERCLKGLAMGSRVNDDYASQLILDALGAQPDDSTRKSVALALYCATHRQRNLRATVFETLAQEIRPILKPGSYKHDPNDCPRERYRQVMELCRKLKDAADPQESSRNGYAANLLQGLLPGGYSTFTPGKILALFCRICDQLEEATAANKNQQPKGK
jgi:MoxR-like ATPase